MIPAGLRVHPGKQKISMGLGLPDFWFIFFGYLEIIFSSYTCERPQDSTVQP